MRKSKKKSNKKCIYTAIIDNYDTLKKPEIIYPDFDYICFTDNPNLKDDLYKIVQVKKKKDKIRQARRIKILGCELLLKKYNFSIWIDTNLVIKSDIQDIINDCLGNNITFFKHPANHTLIYEAKECKRMGKDKVDVIDNQMSEYKKDGFNMKRKIVMSGVMFRRHNNYTKNAMRKWWKEIKVGSFRDQLSWNYIAWENGIKYKQLEHSLFWNNFDWKHHVKNDKLNNI